MDDPLDYALEQQDWAGHFKRLTAYTRGCLGRDGKLEDAEEIANEAIKRVVDPDYRDWDPTKGELLDHLGSEVNGILRNLRRKKTRTKERLHDFGGHAAGEAFHQYDDPTGRMEASQILELVFDCATETDDELAQQLVLAAYDGIVQPKDLAEKLGEPIGRIYEARRRLKSYRDTVLQKEEG